MLDARSPSINPTQEDCHTHHAFQHTQLSLSPSERKEKNQEKQLLLKLGRRAQGCWVLAIKRGQPWVSPEHTPATGVRLSLLLGQAKDRCKPEPESARLKGLPHTAGPKTTMWASGQLTITNSDKISKSNKAATSSAWLRTDTVS